MNSGRNTTFEHYKSGTWRILLLGAIVAVFLNIRHYNIVYDAGMDWTYGFPQGFIAGSLSAMNIFFHEIGHSIVAIFYGYFTVPTFDVFWGGGMAYHFGGQSYFLIALVYGGIAYGLYYTRHYPLYRNSLIAIFIFHLLTAYNAIHEALISFMGHGTVALMAGFFLYRAYMNIAPRGVSERFLNATFGFGFILHELITAYALLTYAPMQNAYYHQKGRVGFGDFNKVADYLDISFNSAVQADIVLNLICFTIPLVLYLRFLRTLNQDRYRISS